MISGPQLHEEKPLEKWQLGLGKEATISDSLHGVAVWASPCMAILGPLLLAPGGEIHGNATSAAVLVACQEVFPLEPLDEIQLLAKDDGTQLNQ